MVILTKKYAVKNSVRYDQPARDQGPVSIYVPNDWFIAKGINPKAAPETLSLDISLEPVFAHREPERT